MMKANDIKAGCPFEKTTRKTPFQNLPPSLPSHPLSSASQPFCFLSVSSLIHNILPQNQTPYDNHLDLFIQHSGRFLYILFI